MKETVFNAKDVLFREGELGNSFYQILEGTAGVYQNYGEADEQKLTEMTAGQYIGELAVIGCVPRSATVVAESTLRVIEIPENGLNEYFQEQPDKIISIMKQIGLRIREVTEEYDEVTAYMQEKQKTDEKEKEGLLARIRKYLSAMGSVKTPFTAEEAIKTNVAARPADSLLPVTSYNRGQIIFREGDDGTFMYCVQSGSVGIYTNYGTALQKKLTTLYTNAFFGEMSLINDEKRSATAVVEEDDTVLEAISADMLEDLFKTNPAEVDMILTHVSNRLRRLTEQYTEACRRAVQEA